MQVVQQPELMEIERKLSALAGLPLTSGELIQIGCRVPSRDGVVCLAAQSALSIVGLCCSYYKVDGYFNVHLDSPSYVRRDRTTNPGLPHGQRIVSLIVCVTPTPTVALEFVWIGWWIDCPLMSILASLPIGDCHQFAMARAHLADTYRMCLPAATPCSRRCRPTQSPTKQGTPNSNSQSLLLLRSATRGWLGHQPNSRLGLTMMGLPSVGGSIDGYFLFF